MTAQQLKNSILQMAVQGKLIPQDPTDEPASVLLERIRAEKEKHIKEGKIKKEKNPSVIFRGEDNLPYEKLLVASHKATSKNPKDFRESAPQRSEKAMSKNSQDFHESVFEAGRIYEGFADGTVKDITDEVPFEIPASWEWVRLGSIVFNHGQKKPDSDFSYIDIGSIDNSNQTLNGSETIISANNAPSRARKIVLYGDILYSTVRPYLHNMCIVNKKFSYEPIASTGFSVLCCYTDFFNQYLFYYMMSPIFDAYANDTENSKGVAYPAINDEKLYRVLIPVPPVTEQHRIVDKYLSMESLIKKYDNIEIHLSTLDNNFPEKLKKSILQQAVMGKLVPQDESDEPASVLLDRIRAEKQALIKAGKLKKDKHESVIYKRDNSHYEKLDGVERCIDDEIPYDIPLNWAWCRIKNIFNLQAGKNIQAPQIHDATTGNDYPCYGGNGIRGYVDSYNHDGDYPIIGRQGALCGNINRATGKFYATEHAVCVDTYADTNILWACLFLTALNLNQYATATAQPGLAVANINEVLIPVPPLPEQRKIVEKTSSLMENLRRF